MPHNAWDAGNPDVGLAGELGWIVSRHPAAVRATVQNVLALGAWSPLAEQGRAAREFFRGSEFKQIVAEVRPGAR